MPQLRGVVLPRGHITVKMWIGVDPGRTGAVAGIMENGQVTFEDWSGEQNAFNLIHFWRIMYDVQAVAMEDTPAMKRDSKQSATTFQQHCGAWKCLIILSGFEPVMVRPQTWMKRRIRAKRGPRDKPSIGYVQRKYPNVAMQGPRGGWKDGRSDAICIAEWCKETQGG